MGKPVEQEAKQKYFSPKLTVYGTVQQLTQAVGLRRHRDGGKFPTTRTALR